MITQVKRPLSVDEIAELLSARYGNRWKCEKGFKLNRYKLKKIGCEYLLTPKGYYNE